MNQVNVYSKEKMRIYHQIFGLKLKKMPKAQINEKVDRMIKLIKLEEHMNKKPSQLSGGQKQRVSMAGVMINHVDILLFDEPLANLDPATGKHAIELIDEIHRTDNTTIVIIEHRLEDALTCGADRIVVVGNGGIVADMSPDELLATNILEEQGIREPLYVTAIISPIYS